ncbi:MAG: hypothetical protein P4L51_21715 [Puia sp.]|nr:hypothetical protein [Puia sp.]
MKFFKILSTVLLALSFTGCLDIDEKIEVRKDGSGDYAMKVDMSQMVEMLQTYVGRDELAKKGMEKMDTTIYMKDLVDTLSGLSAERKALLAPGSVHVKLNLDEKVFTTSMLFPYTSQDNLQKLYTTMSDGSLGTTQLLRGLTPMGQDDMAGAAVGGGSGSDINQFNGIYDFTSRDGLIRKKVNMDKWKELQQNPQLDQLKEAGKMGLEILYTTTVKLPRPVIRVDNPLAKLSEDKRVVMIRYNLIDVFEHPEQFGFTIEY